MLNNSKSLNQFQKACQERRSLLIEGIQEGLWSSPKACLAEMASRATGRSVLLITGGTREDRLFDDLSYFDHPLEFPAWETMPGEDVDPSPDIIGKRFEALHA